MSAELYPGVTLPAWLNLAIFITLSFALDMGGLGLAQIAKTARAQDNVQGAIVGEKLSRWLIGIMIAGLVTVSLEHAVSTIPFDKGVLVWINGFWMLVEITLSVIRCILAVQYGHAVHALEQSVPQPQPAIPDPALVPTIDVEKMTETIEQRISDTLREKLIDLETQIATLTVAKSEPVVKSNETEDDNTGNEESNEVDNQDASIVSIVDYRNGNKSETEEGVSVDTDEIPIVNVASTKGCSSVARNSSTNVSTNNGRGEARQKASRILKKQPQLTPAELAKKAGITRQYASKLIAEFQGNTAS